MDVVAGIATIWSVITAARTVYEFFNDVKDADESCSKIARELYDSTQLLETIHALGIENQERLHDLNSLFVPNGSLDQFRQTIDSLSTKVLMAKGIKSIKKKVQFVLGTTTIQEVLSRLERNKSTFIMCFGVENLGLGLENL